MVHDNFNGTFERGKNRRSHGSRKKNRGLNN